MRACARRCGAAHTDVDVVVLRAVNAAVNRSRPRPSRRAARDRVRRPDREDWPPSASTRRPALGSPPGTCSTLGQPSPTTSEVRGLDRRQRPRRGMAARAAGGTAGRGRALSGDWSPRSGYEAGTRGWPPTRRSPRSSPPTTRWRSACCWRCTRQGGRCPRGQRRRLRRHPESAYSPAADHGPPGPRRGRPPIGRARAHAHRRRRGRAARQSVPPASWWSGPPPPRPPLRNWPGKEGYPLPTGPISGSGQLFWGSNDLVDGFQSER